MTLQELVKLWPQYQNWLKQNNINADNIQEKVPDIIQTLKSNPSVTQQIKSFLHTPELSKIVKRLNIDESYINSVEKTLDSSVGNSVEQSTSFKGNLSPEQIQLIKKSRR